MGADVVTHTTGTTKLCSETDEAMRRDNLYSDVDWRAFPFAAKRTTFRAPSGALAGVTLGDPSHSPVVLVPGLTGSKEDFILMMSELADAGLYVVSYDLAGQYESAEAGPENLRPPRKRYDYDLFAHDLIAILETLASPAHVLGYSFAGVVSQLAFARRPDLFSSLAFLSCPPRTGQSFRHMRHVGWLSSLLGGRACAALMLWGIRRNVNDVPASRLRFVNHRFTFTRRSSIRDVMRLMKRVPNTHGQLAKSTIPKLVAVGTHDIWPEKQHRAFADAIGATFAVYTSGHSPCETAPHQLNRDLLKLFASSQR